MSSQGTTPNYTDISSIKQFWIETIAKQYLDLNYVNNYNAGIFGYINEVLANTTEDGFNSTAVARREFYPVTAQYISSLYEMATLQSIDIPLTEPSTCKVALIIPQREIIENSTFTDGIYECTIDNCLKIFAGELQFMLDYPIKIISRKTDKWTHTTHYDVQVSNSLNSKTGGRYISNKIMKIEGVNYLVLFIDTVRQLQMVEESNVVIKDSIMDTVTMDIDFDGNLANFEVFYKESQSAAEMQLVKVLKNGKAPIVPYVKYELVNPNKIRLIFNYNPIFVPKYNSEVICRIYTSEGADGNFNSFASDLVCSSDSEKYAYNNNMTIIGKVNGSATGGKDQPTIEEFRDTILKAYATNNTVTTSQDLQCYFDDLANSITNVRVLFKKIRDDPLIRLWGAYCVVKDEGRNVIPTNTLDMSFFKGDFVEDLDTSTATRLTIPAGTVFEYKADNSYELVLAKHEDGTKKSIRDISMEDESEKMYFINPFMMCINLNPNNIGYYVISSSKSMSVEYVYVNDGSIQQFITNGLKLYRNSIGGSNYYRFQMMLTPASDVDPLTIVGEPDAKADDYEIIAPYNGSVIKQEYFYDDAIGRGYVRFTVEYDTEVEEEKIAFIQGSNTSPINHESITGYKMNYNVGDVFVAGDIIATKRYSDKGNLLIIGDINGELHENGYYFAFNVQEYDEELGSFIMETYITTTDEIDLSEKIAMCHGFFKKDGEEDDYVAIDMKNLQMECSVLYNNAGANIPHKYSSYKGLNGFTLTNTYVSDENDRFNFIGNLPFIRSTVDFYPPDPNGHKNNFKIRIKESPVLGAYWAASKAQYDYFVAKYNDLNAKLNGRISSDETTLLENNFSIDSKFYNTYGKAKFFTVGNNLDSMVLLDRVRCKFHFGIRLNVITSTELFLEAFRKYVQEYIESDDKITSIGQDLFIMNLISDIRNNFEEIAHLEYYGFNTYDYSAQKVIGPDLTLFIEDFIPEFLNLNILTDSNGVKYPDITVDILET